MALKGRFANQGNGRVKTIRDDFFLDVKVHSYLFTGAIFTISSFALFALALAPLLRLFNEMKVR